MKLFGKSIISRRGYSNVIFQDGSLIALTDSSTQLSYMVGAYSVSVFPATKKEDGLTRSFPAKQS